MTGAQSFAEIDADSIWFHNQAKAAREAERARYAQADEAARAILRPVIRRRWIAARLAELEVIISQWCMRSAWPGKMPTPPFAAWQERADLWREIGRI
jgi:hypothetical protein